MMFDPNFLRDVKQEEDPKVIEQLEKNAWILVVVFLVVMGIAIGLMFTMHQSSPVPSVKP